MRAVGQYGETSLMLAIRDAVNMQRDARVRRNNTGRLQDRKGRWVTFGLGIGSPDLIGEVTIQWGSRAVARAFHLEVKLPGEAPTVDQLAWHDEARRRGVFVAVVRSVDEAMRAIDRCRAGECQ